MLRKLLIPAVLVLGFIYVLAQQAVPSSSATPPVYLGVRYTAIMPIGVQINGVRHDSPAAAAGLQTGDIVLAVNDDYINAGDLRTTISRYEPFDEVVLAIRRGTDHHRVKVILQPHMGTETNQDLALNQLGALRGGTHLPNVHYNPATGIWNISEIMPESVLHEAGLRTGDAVLAVNDQTVPLMRVPSLMTELLFTDVAVLSIARGDEIYDLTVPANLAQLFLYTLPPE